MKVQIIALLLGMLLLSCNEESQKEKMVRLVNEWQGKEIKFPTDLIFTRYITDTTDFQLPTKGRKVLIYVDSTGCVDCKLQLKKWKEFIAYIDSVTGSSVPFLFFFHSKNIRETAAILRGDKFNYPVCVDRSDRLNKLNGFPSDIRFQTFILDADNKVTVLGNPIHNLSVKDLYIRELTGKSPTMQQKTTAMADNTIFDLGTLSPAETKKVSLTLTNTGKFPLVILDVQTTCGCTDITFEKHAAQTNENLTVSIRMTAKESGSFSETITVRANINHPIRVQIKGNVR